MFTSVLRPLLPYALGVVGLMAVAGYISFQQAQVKAAKKKIEQLSTSLNDANKQTKAANKYVIQVDNLREKDRLILLKQLEKQRETAENIQRARDNADRRNASLLVRVQQLEAQYEDVAAYNHNCIIPDVLMREYVNTLRGSGRAVNHFPAGPLSSADYNPDAN